MKRAVLLLLVGLSTSLNAQPMKFDYFEIGQFGNRMGQTSLVDVDNDHDLDWVFGRFGNMFWFEYQSASEWELHEIGKGAVTDVGGCALDVNQDGWMDFVAGNSWYENSQDPKNKEFAIHTKNMISSHDNVAVDIDGDGIKDIVSISNHVDHPVLAWYKIPEDFYNNWNYHKIGAGIHGGISPKGYGDLDQDGDIDIVRGDAWFEQLDGKGKEWKQHHDLVPEHGSRPGKFGLALKSYCTDLDADGDLDIVQSEADTGNGRVYWFENILQKKTFKFHSISGTDTKQDFHSLSVADFNNDGDYDVLSGGGPLSESERALFIWENLDGSASKWKMHKIISGVRVHEAVAADVDGDGDIDICAKPWHGDLHFYLQNKLIDNRKN